jgi:DNA-binding CsgD family transcriptional regulator
MSQKLNDSHISLTSASAIKEICKPLFDSFGLTHFHFRRTFNDRSRAVLCTNADWVSYFYGEKKYDAYGIYEAPDEQGNVTISEPLFENFQNYNSTLNKQIPKKNNKKVIANSQDIEVPAQKQILTSGYVLWIALHEQPIFNHIFRDAKQFKIDNGITFTERDENSCTFYQIGTTPENAHLINFYMNNLDVIKLFIKYFKEKASDLIKLAEANRIISYDSIKKSASLQKNISPLTSPKMFEYFLKQISFEKYCLGQQYGNNYFTPREAQCVYYLLKGYTAKQVALALNISSRTVEYYIDTIKLKLNTRTKSQAIIKLHELADKEIWQSK